MPITNKTKATIEAITQHCTDTRSFLLRLEKPFSYAAGQFLMVSIPHSGRLVRRSYSIASPPGNEMLEICLNYLPSGAASEFLFNANEGTPVEVDGPYGVFTVKSSSRDRLFIATGTGIAPIRAMIMDLLQQPLPQRITLIFGERTEAELLYRKEFEAIAQKHHHFRYVPVLSRAAGSWDGERGYVQDAMQKYLKAPKEVDVYICGLRDMVDDVKGKLLAMGVDARNILTEKFV